MMEFVSRAVADCCDDEMDLFSQDIREDSILSGIRSFVEDEVIEFRQDNNSKPGMTRPEMPVGGMVLDGASALWLMGRSHRKAEPCLEHVDDDRTDFLVAGNAKFSTEIDQQDDDEATDFLVTRNLGLATIPDQICFKSKKSRRRAIEESNEQVSRPGQPTGYVTDTSSGARINAPNQQTKGKMVEIRPGGKSVGYNQEFSYQHGAVSMESRTTRAGRDETSIVRRENRDSNDELGEMEGLKRPIRGFSARMKDEKKNVWKLLPFQKRSGEYT